MKILFIEWESFGNQDILEAFLAEGHDVSCFPFTYHGEQRNDPVVESRLSSTLHSEVPDVVFSFAFFPVISKVCQQEGIRYIAWVYDSPDVLLYSYTVINPCNEIYVFDKEIYKEFQNGGVPTVHYMPMAVNTDRLHEITKTLSAFPYTYDISFVGSLYTEDHDFFGRMKGLSDRVRGYLDGCMAAQREIQGYNFIQDILGPVMDDLYQALPMDPNGDGIESREWLFAQYVINRKITAMERTDLLTAIAGRHPLDLFTIDRSFSAPGLRNHGTVDYYDEMPQVFCQSRINLNISLRSIKSGIPLRVFDIMGSGGFVLSNFQSDLLDLFVPGEDFVYYESKMDLLQKIDYYLDHEEERQAIARNGYAKVAAGHTYRHRVREMLRS